MLAKRDHTMIVWLVALAAITSMPGCNAFGLRKQLQQLESENNRLLSEFRAERQRRETAEKTAQQLEIRLSESEKLLARQLQNGSPGRLSSLPGHPTRPGTSGSINEGAPTGSAGRIDPRQDPLGTISDFQWQRRTN